MKKMKKINNILSFIQGSPDFPCHSFHPSRLDSFWCHICNQSSVRICWAAKIKWNSSSLKSNPFVKVKHNFSFQQKFSFLSEKVCEKKGGRPPKLWVQNIDFPKKTQSDQIIIDRSNRISPLSHTLHGEVSGDLVGAHWGRGALLDQFLEFTFVSCHRPALWSGWKYSLAYDIEIFI